NTVSVRLGDGVGGFAGTTEVSVGTDPYHVAVGDVNGDGNQDFVVTNTTSNTVSVRLGNGSGGFTGTTNYTVASTPKSIVLTDVNNDGKLDIVAGVQSGISLLVGDGSGGFGSTVNTAVTGNTSLISSGDFNNDGKADILIAHLGTTSVALLIGDGNGGFAAPTTTTVSTGGHSAITVGDFNADGNQDFAVGFVSLPVIDIRLGTGSGTFTSGVSLSAPITNALNNGDLDGDGKIDLIKDNGWYKGNGDGTFGSLQNLLGGLYSPSNIALGDVNTDSKLDIVSTNIDHAEARLSGINEINVQGGSPLANIVSGSTTVSTTNGTDLGGIVGTSVATTYTIQNTGNSVLNVSSITSNNSEFVISSVPASVAAGGSATFTVTFTPTVDGDRAATISINNNDCDEATYTFKVQGGRGAGSLAFDGINDGVTTTGTMLATPPTQFTIEWWLYPTSANNGEQGLGIGNNWGDFAFHTMAGGAVYVGTDLTNRLTPAELPAGTVTLNTWQHFTFTFNNGEGRFYKNGVLLASKFGMQTPTNFNTFYIGVPATSSYIHGFLDEVRVWSTARSCEELKQYRNCELTGSEPNLLCYFKFNQGVASGTNTSQTTLNNSVSNSITGTLTNFNLTNGNSTSNWVSNAAVAVGVSCPGSITAPEINVQGNGANNIVDGQTTPSTTNGTDFGSVTTVAIAKTYTIQNTGNSILNVSGITSSNASEFVVSGAPASVAAGSSATFTVTFTPTAVGVRAATIHVNNNDCDEADYDFAVQGTGVAATALHFDGNAPSDNVNSPVFTAFGTEPATIEFWAKNEGSFTFPVGFANSYLFLFAGGNLFIRKDFVGDYNTGASVSTSGTVWEHFAITYDGNGTWRAYKNGLPTPNATFTGFSGSAATGTLQIGEPKGGYPYTGAIDEVRFWREQRTDAQILSSYNTEIASMDPCLKVYWKFNQGVIGANNSAITTATDDANATNENGTL
ncbi:MAG: VCBS repeat-containing protein, partial [Candidatus Kapabacteria bacterium]|nr:VCBS repeat-containing protein [Candidatus Kapabacteria bacterium]